MFRTFVYRKTYEMTMRRWERRFDKPQGSWPTFTERLAYEWLYRLDADAHTEALYDAEWDDRASFA